MRLEAAPCGRIRRLAGGCDEKLCFPHPLAADQTQCPAGKGMAGQVGVVCYRILEVVLPERTMQIKVLLYGSQGVGS